MYSPLGSKRIDTIFYLDQSISTNSKKATLMTSGFTPLIEGMSDNNHNISLTNQYEEGGSFIGDAISTISTKAGETQNHLAHSKNILGIGSKVENKAYESLNDIAKHWKGYSSDSEYSFEVIFVADDYDADYTRDLNRLLRRLTPVRKNKKVGTKGSVLAEISPPSGYISATRFEDKNPQGTFRVRTGTKGNHFYSPALVPNSYSLEKSPSFTDISSDPNVTKLIPSYTKLTISLGTVRKNDYHDIVHTARPRK